MFRLYRGMVEQILFMLLYSRDRASRWDTYFEYARDQWTEMRAGKDPNTVSVVRNILDGPQDEWKEPRDLIAELTTLLFEEQAGQTSRHEKDLIDLIVQTLQLSYGRNRFGSESLDKLRKAILLPAELAGLKAKLLGELTCDGCGHGFKSGEMGSIVMDGGRDGSAVLRCTNCWIPELIASQCQKHSVTAPKNIEVTIRKAAAKCEACRIEAEQGAAPGAAEPPPTVGRGDYVGRGARVTMAGIAPAMQAPQLTNAQTQYIHYITNAANATIGNDPFIRPMVQPVAPDINPEQRENINRLMADLLRERGAPTRADGVDELAPFDDLADDPWEDDRAADAEDDGGEP